MRRAVLSWASSASTVPARRAAFDRFGAGGQTELGELARDVARVDVGTGITQRLARTGDSPTLTHAGCDAVGDLGQPFPERAGLGLSNRLVELTAGIECIAHEPPPGILQRERVDVFLARIARNREGHPSGPCGPAHRRGHDDRQAGDDAHGGPRARQQDAAGRGHGAARPAG